VARNWCKVAADLDLHPKIRKAGNLGRQVFEYALRRNAALDLGGYVPADYFEPDYMALHLMLSALEASEGLSRAVTAELLRCDGAAYVVCGWDDEWAKRPLTEAERQQKRRDKIKASEEGDHNVTEASRPESDCPDNHAREEKREEEKRRDKKAKRPFVIPEDWAPRPQELAKAREMGIDGENEAESFRDWHTSKGTQYVDWDATFRTWLRNHKKWDKSGNQTEIRSIPRLRR
jgi:hypothetical protein